MVIKIHITFDKDGHNQNDKYDRGKAQLIGVQNFCERAFQQLQSHQQDNDSNKQPGDIFDPSVSEGMIRVGLLSCHAEADQGNDRGAGIGEVIEGIGGDGNGVADQSGDEFSGEKAEIQKNADRTAQHAVGLPYGRVPRVRSILNKELGK